MVEKICDVVKDQQLIDNNILVGTDSNEQDYQWTISSPIMMKGQEKKQPGEAPGLGEHTEEILTEFGFSESEISSLISEKVASKS